MLSMYGNGLTPVFTAWVTSVILPWSCKNFGEKLLIQSMSRYIKSTTLSERCQYGLFLKVAARAKQIMVTRGNERLWTFKRLGENKKKLECRRGVRSEGIAIRVGVRVEDRRRTCHPWSTQRSSSQDRHRHCRFLQCDTKDIVEFGYAPGCRMTCADSEEWTRS